MKKILVIALALLMLVSTLAACGSSGNTDYHNIVHICIVRMWTIF